MAQSKKIIKCQECREQKPHYSNGLCHKCYAADWRKKKKHNERIREEAEYDGGGVPDPVWSLEGFMENT